LTATGTEVGPRVELRSTPVHVARAGAIVFVGIVVANAGNYLFHLASARMLGPAEYSDVATLVAIAGLISFPLIGVQLALARYVSHFAVTSESRTIAAIYQRSFGLGLKFGGAITVLFLAVSVPLQRILGIDSLTAVVLTMLVTWPVVLGPIVWGLAQGLERYRLFALAIGAGPAVRAVLVVIFLAFGLGVAGAMGATLAGTVVALVFPLWLLRDWLRPSVSARIPVSRREATAYVVPVIVGVLSITSLTTADVIVAKLALPDHQAGLYGGASLIGRAILYLPAAIVTVLLPRVSARRAAGRSTREVLHRSLMATAAFCLLAIAAYATLPRLLVDVAFGSEYEDAGSLLWRFAVVMSGYAVVNILLVYQLGRGVSAFSWILLIGAVAQLALFGMFHDSPRQLLQVDAAVAFALIVAYAVAARTPGRWSLRE
jgi:O-antigen/teichoic acid export membrane protein